MFADELLEELEEEIPKFTEKDLNLEGDGYKLVKIRCLQSHEGPVTCVKYLTDETKVISSSEDGTVRVWDITNGDEIACYRNLHAAPMTQCNLNHDDSKFVTTGFDKRVVCVDTETQAVLWSGRHDGITTYCSFSWDDSLAVSCSDLDRSVKVWDTNSGECLQCIKDLHTSTITSCKYDRAGTRIITTSMDKSCKFWDTKSCSTTLTLADHRGVISASDMPSCGHLLATCGWDKRVMLYDITTGMYRSKGPKLMGSHDGCASAVSFNESGSLLVSSSYDTGIIVWDTGEGRQKLKILGHDDWVTDVKMNKAGTQVLSSSKDSTIRIWNLEECDKLPNQDDSSKSNIAKIANCHKCGKTFSVTMLDDSQGPGMTQCVFCRIESRPTIWSIVEDIVQIDGDEGAAEEDGEEKGAGEGSDLNNRPGKGPQ